VAVAQKHTHRLARNVQVEARCTGRDAELACDLTVAHPFIVVPEQYISLQPRERIERLSEI
jgi:hypothetical protein